MCRGTRGRDRERRGEQARRPQQAPRPLAGCGPGHPWLSLKLPMRGPARFSGWQGQIPGHAVTCVNRRRRGSGVRETQSKATLGTIHHAQLGEGPELFLPQREAPLLLKLVQDPRVAGMTCAFLPRHSGLSAQTARPAFSRITRHAAACRHPRAPEQPWGKAQAGFRRPAVEPGAFLITPGSRCEVLKNPSKFTSVAGAPHSDLEGPLPDGWSRHHVAENAPCFSREWAAPAGAAGTCCRGGAPGQRG